MARPTSEAAGARVLRSISWNAGGEVASQVISLVRVFATARLLRPEDFGLFALTMVVFGVVAVLTDIGLRPAYVSRKIEESSETDWLDTIWSAEIVLKVVMGLVIALLAYPAALYFEEPRVTSLLVVLGFAPALRMLGSPALLQSERRIDFRKVALVDLGGSVISCIVTVVSAWLLRSAWAFVFGHVSGMFSSMVFSYVVAPRRPRFRIVRPVLREAMGYGRHMLALSVLNFVAARFDNLVVAKLIGASSLGFYTIAYRFVELPFGVLNGVVGRVLLPYYAEAHRQGERALGDAFRLSARYGLWALLGGYGALALFPEFIVRIAAGPQWSTAATVLPILAAGGFLRAITRLQGTLLQAAGRPQWDARAMTAEVATLVVVSLYATQRWGLRGAAFAVVSSFLVGTLVRAPIVLMQLRAGPTWLLGLCARPLLGVGAAAGGAWLVEAGTGSQLAGCATFAAVLGALALALEPWFRATALRLRPGVH